MLRIIEGKSVASEIDAKSAEQVKMLKEEFNVTPTLNIMVIEGDRSSELYVKHKTNACEKIGGRVHITSFKKDVQLEDIINGVEIANQDNMIHGILLQLPLPPHLNEVRITSSISLEKDIDGLNPMGIGILTFGGKAYASAGAEAAKILIEKSGMLSKRSHCVILGASNIFGKPFASLILRDIQGVTVLPTLFEGLDKLTTMADVLIVDVASPKFLKGHMVKNGCVVVDAGSNFVDGKVVGDVDAESISEVASVLTPVPGGLGPVLISVLLSHLVDAATIQAKKHHNR